jgi:hypothetical protein
MFTWSFAGVVAGERRDDLAGVHVRRGPRSGLEDVDWNGSSCSPAAAVAMRPAIARPAARLALTALRP